MDESAGVVMASWNRLPAARVEIDVGHSVIPFGEPIDPLGEALRVLRLDAVFYCRSELTAPWALALPPFPHSMMLHVVTSGGCWVDVPGTAPAFLRAGMIALVPHGEGHELAGDRGVPPVDLFEAPRRLLSERFELLRHGGGGSRTSMLCGVARFDHPASDEIKRWLPRLICVDATEGPRADWLASTLRLVSTEAQALSAGADEVIRRLADMLVLEAIRSWASRENGASGWFAALRDPQIGRALAMIAREPSRRWTVAALARTCGMSRSAFAKRFTELVQVPVLQHVRRWKMHEAARLLGSEGASLGAVAERLGYSNEAALSRAFKRVTGSAPGTLRRRSSAKRPAAEVGVGP